ncbi:hypothetical protein KR093_011185 [Drosophila rubida]|uniref:Venom serine protease 34 n=1 Tax=Drosophila rubida TaxID=30044 RepID=A0AAD4JRJ3_9MUSC|nr:hypothetical protein KR093_011185 [Drosophila rubida]
MWCKQLALVLGLCMLSGQFIMTLALFEQCNHQVDLQAGQKIYINSPYYPGLYPVGSSCRYTVQAPKDHVLKFKCDLQLQTLVKDTRCRTEVFHFNAEGDELLTSSEYFCGTGKFERQSFLNRAVISYISQRKESPAAVLVPKLKDKLPARVTTTSSTSTSTSTTTTQAPPVEQLEDEDEKQAIEEEDDDDDEFSNEVLHVLQDVGVSDALAYVASLLYDDSNNGRRIASTPAPASLAQLLRRPRRRTPKTSAKRAKILSIYPLAAPSGGGRFSCLVEAIVPSCNCGWSLTQRIASPTNDEAALHEFPSMAGVLTKKLGRVFCGAAIIHHHYLLSAAHCFLSAETREAAQLRIVVGEHDLSSAYETLFTRHYELDALIPHEQFSQSNGQLRNDIALLRTRLPILWNRNVGPACLPLQPAENGRKLPLVGQQLLAAGWGTTSYGGPQTARLLKTTLDVISGEQCRSSLAEGSVPLHSFCTYTPGRDTCQYDSGGALYERSRGRLLAVGIVSYGFACATQQPSVNTRVASFIKWIRAKTPEVAYCLKQA